MGASLTADDWTAILLSLKIASVAAAASLPVAIAVAWALARMRFAGRAALDGLVNLPLVLPPVVTGYALLLLFGRQGPLGIALESVGIVLSFRWTGAALASAIMSFPLMVRAVRLSIEAVDPALGHAAATLGATRMRVFLHVTLPLALPGVIAGSLLGFAKAFGEFGATITFVSAIPGETRTIPAAIYGYTQAPGGDDGALRLSLVSAAVAFGAVIISELLTYRVLGPGRLASGALREAGGTNRSDR